MSPCTVDLLPVGDHRRSAVGGPAVRTLGFAAVFFVFMWVTKEVPFINAAEPWQDDPYDALVSFGLVAIPFLVGIAAIRLRLCRRHEPLPTRRLADLLRLSRSALAVIVVVILSEWVSVVASVSKIRFAATTTALLVLLAACTTASAMLSRSLGRAGHHLPTAPSQPDLLADCVALAEREAGRLGPLADPTRQLVSRLELMVIARVRDRPLVASGITAAGVGAAFAAPKIFIEHYRPTLVAFVFVVSTCSFFAFLVLVGSRLRLVEPRRAAAPNVTTIAVTAASMAVPLAVTFRNSLWWVIGMTASAADLGDFVLLCSVAALVAMVVAPIVVRSMRQ